MSDAPTTEPPAAAATAPRNSFGWAALGIVIAAGGLRLWGLELGLPHLEARPDETETLRLTLDAAGGSFDFDWAIYPHAYVYLQWAWAELVLLVQSWLGLVATGDMEQVWRSEPERLYAIGRWLSALAGTATVVVVLATARRELGATVALIAGAWLAVNLLHVRESHALKPDILLSLGLAACLAAAASLARRRDVTSAIAAGAAVGAASAMKYNGVLGALPVCVGAWMGARDASGLRRWLPASLVVAGASAVGAFALANPFLLSNEAAHAVVQGNLHAVFPDLIDAPRAVPDIDMSRPEGPGMPDWVAPYGGFSALVYHFGFSFWHGVGAVATLLAPVAVGFGLRSKRALLRVSAVFALAWFVVIALSPVTLSRYVTPMLPALAILQAALICELAGRFAPARASLAAALVALLVLAQPALASVRFDQLAARSDTRAEALRWLAANARGARVAVVGTRFWHWGEPRLPQTATRVALPAAGRVDRRAVDYLVTHDHELYWSEIPDGFLERNADRLELLVDLDPRDGAEGSPVFEPNDAYYIPISGFAGVSAPGPHVRIYRVR